MPTFSYMVLVVKTYMCCMFGYKGVYGDVHRVKMHYHKPDTAFVQFSTVEQAERATKLLHGQQVFGRRLRVFYSHLQEIQLHQAQTGPDGQPLTVRIFVHNVSFPSSVNTSTIT